MSEDYAEASYETSDDHFLYIRDSQGRSALHIAAAGSSPLMVDYLLTYARICLDKAKHAEMLRIKEVEIFTHLLNVSMFITHTIYINMSHAL